MPGSSCQGAVPLGGQILLLIYFFSQASETDNRQGFAPRYCWPRSGRKLEVCGKTISTRERRGSRLDLTGKEEQTGVEAILAGHQGAVLAGATADQQVLVKARSS